MLKSEIMHVDGVETVSEDLDEQQLNKRVEYDSTTTQYYDNVRPLLLYRWLRQRGAHLGMSMTLLRLHCLPSLRITVGHSVCQIVGRCFGLLTGTRSAAVAGRIPLADVAARRIHT